MQRRDFRTFTFLFTLTFTLLIFFLFFWSTVSPVAIMAGQLIYAQGLGPMLEPRLQYERPTLVPNRTTQGKSGPLL